MSNTCRMPLKSFLQCIRQSPCFKSDPRDERMELCYKDPKVREECAVFESTYKQCKLHLIDGTSRMRGNKALRTGDQ